MIKKLTAAKILISLLSLTTIFHVLVLLQIIPYDIVWAGKITCTEDMYVFESISLLINVFLLRVVTKKLNNLKKGTTNKSIDLILWVFVVVFGLNTIGNFCATTVIEFVLGTILTGISAYLCWVLVKKNKTIP